MNEPTSAPRRLVWLAEVPWRGLPQRHHHLVRQLQANWEVLFVEPPPPLRAPKWRIEMCERVRVAQVVPLVNAKPQVVRRALRHSWLRHLAERAAAGQVLHILRRLGWLGDRARLAVVCSNVYLAGVIGSINPSIALADLCDDPRYLPGEPPWVSEYLARSVANADIVTTSSRTLLRQLVQLGVSRPIYIPNGVDEALVSANASGRFPRPRSARAGYLGFIGPWLDLDLLERVARILPEIPFELVGPIARSEGARVQALLRLPNVTLSAPVAEYDIGSVMARFTVGLIPFRVTPLTSAVNPNKLYEYAALDLPIVSTPFSPEVRDLAGTIDVCSSPDEFARAVRLRATQVETGHTRHVAEAHTWWAIGRQFAALIELPQAASAPDDKRRRWSAPSLPSESSSRARDHSRVVRRDVNDLTREA